MSQSFFALALALALALAACGTEPTPSQRLHIDLVPHPGDTSADNGTTPAPQPEPGATIELAWVARDYVDIIGAPMTMTCDGPATGIYTDDGMRAIIAASYLPLPTAARAYTADGSTTVDRYVVADVAPGVDMVAEFTIDWHARTGTYDADFAGAGACRAELTLP